MSARPARNTAMATDWKRVYERSRAEVRIVGLFKLVVAVGVGVVGCIMGTILALAVDDGLVPAAIFWAAATTGALVYGLQAYRIVRGKPLVVRGTLLDKERRESASSTASTTRTVRYLLHVDARECLRLSASGDASPTGKPGRRSVQAQRALWEQIDPGAEVELVCTPTGEAFSQVNDVLDP